MSSLCHVGLEEEFGRFSDWRERGQQPAEFTAFNRKASDHCVRISHSQPDPASNSGAEKNHLQVRQETILFTVVHCSYHLTSLMHNANTICRPVRTSHQWCTTCHSLFLYRRDKGFFIFLHFIFYCILPILMGLISHSLFHNLITICVLQQTCFPREI